MNLRNLSVRWRWLQIDRSKVIAQYEVQLAEFGKLSTADASVHAQVMSPEMKQALLKVGFLRQRGDTPVVAWTRIGIITYKNVNSRLYPNRFKPLRLLGF